MYLRLVEGKYLEKNVQRNNALCLAVQARKHQEVHSVQSMSTKCARKRIPTVTGMGFYAEMPNAGGKSSLSHSITLQSSVKIPATLTRREESLAV